MERDFKGIWIPKKIWLNKDLGWIEKLVLAEIDSLDSNEAGCFASNSYFANFFDLSTVRISQIISSLVSKGFLVSKFIYKQNSKEIEYRILKPTTPLKESFNTPLKESFNTPLKISFKDNNTEDINTCINTKEKQVKENENYHNSESSYLQKVANEVLEKSEIQSEISKPKNDLVNIGQKALSEKEQANSEISKNLVLNTKKTEDTPPIAPPSDPQTNNAKAIRDKKATKIALLEQRSVLIQNKQENEKLKPFCEEFGQFIELQDKLFLNKVRKQPLTQNLIELHEKKIIKCLDLGANVQEIKDAIELDIVKEYQTIEYGLDKIIKKYEFFSKSVLLKQQQNAQKEQPKPIIKNTDLTKKLD